MPFDNPDKPADINAVVTTSEFHHDLFRQQDATKFAPGTQEVALPSDSTVIAPTTGGLIKYIKLPGLWTKAQLIATAAGARFESYSLEGTKDKDVTASMSYEYHIGNSHLTAEDIRRVMAQPDHKLSRSEIDQVRKGFGNDQAHPEYFDLNQSWTKTIHGRPVLFVEGVSKDPSKLHTLTTYIDPDSRHPGRLPESVTFAMKDRSNFQKYLPLAIKAFESIEWKTHADTHTGS
jgi:hypothetical protein